MFDCYIRLQQLPDKVKLSNKIKIGKTPRLDCIAFAGYYKGIEPLISKKGQLKFYLMETRGIINSNDQRRANYFLMGDKSINFSSLFIQNFETNNFLYGFGEPNRNKVLKNGQTNPMHSYSNDGYLFIIKPDFTEIEILIISNGRYLIQGYLKELANGKYNEALEMMRKQAKPIYNY